MVISRTVIVRLKACWLFTYAGYLLPFLSIFSLKEKINKFQTYNFLRFMNCLEFHLSMLSGVLKETRLLGGGCSCCLRESNHCKQQYIGIYRYLRGTFYRYIGAVVLECPAHRNLDLLFWLFWLSIQNMKAKLHADLPNNFQHKFIGTIAQAAK